MTARAGSTAALTSAALLCGCDSMMSAVDPAGPQAERISGLTWFMVILLSAVYLIVMAMFLYALWRGRRRTENAAGPAVERRMTLWVAGSVGVTAVILFVLLGLNFTTGRALADFADPDALVIEVTGHQWWWEIEYHDPVAARRVLTANEIVIPVGRRVRVLAESRDVIHSFWVPNLHGKIDMIPGYRGSTYLQADAPGVYAGKCAEFCGMQHARMDMRVIAVPPDSFALWYDHQLKPASPPADTLQQRGEDVFLSTRCASCHSIRGTPAGSRVGPDLTHLASRTTIAAGTLPNTRGHLAGWILDPQKIKPGVRMPPNQLGSHELHALLHYLQGLK